MKRAVLMGVVGVVAVVVVGCTQVSAGEPRPVTSVGSTEPSRPREIDLTGMDPCSLVPESDLPGFDVDKPGEPERDKNFDAPACFYTGNDHGYYLTLVTTEGIEVWSDGSRKAKVGEIEPVDGFPAITLFTDLDPNGCDVVVDVADGQYLKTTVLPYNTEVSFSESCDLAHGLAESAMSTLVGE